MKKLVKYIVIHCSATRENQNYSVESLLRDHKARGFSQIGYNYYITKDGTVNKCRPENIQGAHCTLNYKGNGSLNKTGLSICYEGGLDSNGKPKDTRTEQQKQSILSCIKDICSRYRIEEILGHRDASPDLDNDGIIEPNEWVKQCPCFNAKEEYNYLVSNNE